MIAAPTLDSVAAISGHGEAFETYRSLEPLVRMGAQFVGTLVIAMAVLGLLQGFGTRAVTKSRQSPVISLCIGLPGLLIVGGIASTGMFISDTSVGPFFAIPMVIFGATVLPVVLAVGFTAIGRTVASRLGSDRLWVGVLVGAIVSGLASLALPATVAVAGVAGALGLGATVRILSGGIGAGRPDERTVPPANKI
ncbi:hypothetical protein [Natrinema sp. 1APR25-10V2]|uniref:hypothetical protein n=1 Tax=Natrinema sp. 1APR25-10V2 TaxID=2951081 RepID=UPI00287406B2|nr:hypothetical protein [Natrinema sp. 1APR25-10V2]MDS0474259.1 hypothetical protein [Natrinema sp. 1APR25-10V2]